MPPSIPGGPAADMRAGVDLFRASNGFSESPEKAKFFIENGIVPIQGEMPRELVYADFGGGEGYLAMMVSGHLSRTWHSPKTTVLDANPEFLKKAAARGLDTMECDLVKTRVPGTDLITMRAVLHYNPEGAQARILANAYFSLNPGGYLVNQPTTGNEANCALRNDIVNLPELGRNGGICFTPICKYLRMLDQTGLWETYLAAIDKSYPWRLDDQWRRFNPDGGDRDAFYRKAGKIIEQYAREYGEGVLGLRETGRGIEIDCDFPIIVSQRK